MIVEYGPFSTRFNEDELKRYGDSMLIQRDGTYIIRSGEMSERDASLMAKTLVSAGYIVKVRP